MRWAKRLTSTGLCEGVWACASVCDGQEGGDDCERCLAVGEPWLKLVGSPARGAAGQLVDAKAWLLCLSRYAVGFPL